MSKIALRNRAQAMSKTTEHKVLHKVRKHWKVIGLSALLLIAGTSAMQTNASADTTNAKPQSAGNTVDNGGGQVTICL